MAVKEKTATLSTPKSGMTLSRRRTLVGVSFITPNFVGFFVLNLIPILFALLLCFNRWDGYNPMKFAGLENFKYIFTHNVFQQAVFKTAVFTAFSVGITMLLSLGLAVLINQKLKGIGIFRTAIFFPYVASVVAVAAVWQMLFQKDMGLINEVLRALGVADPPAGSPPPSGPWLASS